MRIIEASTQAETKSLADLYPDRHGEDRTKVLGSFYKHFQEVASGDRILYLLKDGHNTVGAVSLILKKDNSEEPRLYGSTTGHIQHLRIRPDYQGRKLSGMLITRLEQDACGLGLGTLTLGVEPDNQTAVDVYSHWGYEYFLEYQADAGHGATQTIIGMKKALQNGGSS